jgi:hypothetical protein
MAAYLLLLGIAYGTGCVTGRDNRQAIKIEEYKIPKKLEIPYSAQLSISKDDNIMLQIDNFDVTLGEGYSRKTVKSWISKQVPRGGYVASFEPHGIIGIPAVLYMEKYCQGQDGKEQSSRLYFDSEGFAHDLEDVSPCGKFSKREIKTIYAQIELALVEAAKYEINGKKQW